MGAIAPLVVIILIVFFLASSLRVLREYQRGVVFQLGRFWKVKGPGLVILIPNVRADLQRRLDLCGPDPPGRH